MTNEKLREWLEGELGKYDSLQEFLNDQEWKLSSHKQKIAFKTISNTHYRKTYWSGTKQVSDRFIQTNKAGRLYNTKTGRFIRQGK